MFGAILKATNCSFQKGMTFYRSIYVKKVTKLLAFIFEQPSYFRGLPNWKTNNTFKNLQSFGFLKLCLCEITNSML